MMEVARGIMGLETPLVNFPGGTANLMAVDLGIPKDLSNAADMVVDEHSAIHSIDVGRSGAGNFMLWVGMGFLARKVEYANRKLKDRFGVMAYTLAALEAIKSQNVAKLLDVSSFEQPDIATSISPSLVRLPRVGNRPIPTIGRMSRSYG